MDIKSLLLVEEVPESKKVQKDEHTLESSPETKRVLKDELNSESS